VRLAIVELKDKDPEGGGGWENRRPNNVSLTFEEYRAKSSSLMLLDAYVTLINSLLRKKKGEGRTVRKNFFGVESKI